MASGFGYNGLESGQEKWDKVVGTYIWDVETCTNLTEFSNKWNWQVAQFLRNYIYYQVIPEGGKGDGRANLITFMVSGFWHGFYPTYYVVFFFYALGKGLMAEWYKGWILFKFFPAPVRAITGWTVCWLIGSYFYYVF